MGFSSALEQREVRTFEWFNIINHVDPFWRDLWKFSMEGDVYFLIRKTECECHILICIRLLQALGFVWSHDTEPVACLVVERPLKRESLYQKRLISSRICARETGCRILIATIAYCGTVTRRYPFEFSGKGEHSNVEKNRAPGTEKEGGVHLTLISLFANGNWTRPSEVVVVKWCSSYLCTDAGEVFARQVTITGTEYLGWVTGWLFLLLHLKTGQRWQSLLGVKDK